MRFLTNEAKRLPAAFGFAMRGLRRALAEPAFRLELAVACVLIPLACALRVSAEERRWLVASVVLVMVVEILNTALEITIDRISTERHPLSGQAKDLGSAAVFVTIVLTAGLWIQIMLF